MPAIGDRITDDELAALELKRPADAVVVWGADWDGNLVPRAVRRGYGAALVGEYGKKFDVRGPEALLCVECGDLLVVQAAGEMTLLYQRHLRSEHGISAPLLP